jgi:hypothetical protein
MHHFTLGFWSWSRSQTSKYYSKCCTHHVGWSRGSNSVLERKHFGLNILTSMYHGYNVPHVNWVTLIFLIKYISVYSLFVNSNLVSTTGIYWLHWKGKWLNRRKGFSLCITWWYLICSRQYLFTQFRVSRHEETKLFLTWSLAPRLRRQSCQSIHSDIHYHVVQGVLQVT